ncbi:unnamed protein product [Dracunculus medinensis]|uniref:Succinate dehydrogenase cytochrome b560 subunit, mitochondrial n=1 Tax=Dracunculus medinensis TaxID=318479 RepID=A0A0N4U1F3_DRAME|nr:unnamed protein product [Dracunculus medinensis]
MYLLPYRMGLCRVPLRNIQSLKLMQTSAQSKSAAKTPIQIWGWNYLMRQRALKRPISPHLQVYKPQLTWMVSGFHRMTGCAMAGTLLIGGVGFALLPLNFTIFIEFIRGLGLPWIITDAFKFIIAYPIVFHTLNGIRFIAFDCALGTDIASKMTIVDDQHIVSPNCSTGSDHAVLSNETMVRKSDITVEPLCDFELEKYSVRGFVVDYINYRLAEEGLEWYERPEIAEHDLPEYEAMRFLAKLFEKNHKRELEKMVFELIGDDQYIFQARYIELVKNFCLVGPENKMTYARLIALIAFCGLFAVHMAQNNCRDAISSIALYTWKYLQHRIHMTWYQDGKSWVKIPFLQMIIHI